MSKYLTQWTNWRHSTRLNAKNEYLMNICKVQEEEMLVAEQRKIDMRKKEREKKQQDLQKLITAAENQADSYRFKYV